ncbi:recombinase family protein [Bacillus mycoides]|uniref:recombinase family protein n=1 Tax=Bacillus mycoides TaxID=1405 RepID=UPI002E1B1690|nr:recombinase family protein [Bacillus mycoides]
MTIYGYARVSTLHQDLEVQIQSLKKEGCQEIFEEKFTGTKVDRPEFNKLLKKLKKDDKLIITKLDRLARNTKEGIQIIEELFKKDVKVHVLNVGLLEDTTMGNFFLQTLLAVAEMERNLIVERTQEGKAIARQRDDFKEGRPKKFNKKQVEHALQLLESHSYKQVEELTGISKSTLIRAKKKQEATQ